MLCEIPQIIELTSTTGFQVGKSVWINQFTGKKTIFHSRYLFQCAHIQEKFTDRVLEIHGNFVGPVVVLYECKLIKCFLILVCNILWRLSSTHNKEACLFVFLSVAPKRSGRDLESRPYTNSKSVSPKAGRGHISYMQSCIHVKLWTSSV